MVLAKAGCLLCYPRPKGRGNIPKAYLTVFLQLPRPLGRGLDEIGLALAKILK